MALSSQDMGSHRAIKEEVKPPRLDFEGTAIRLGEVAALVLWLAVWIIDANFTASFFSKVFQWTLVLGLVGHLVVSFIQHHYGKSLRAQREAVKAARARGEQVARVPAGDIAKVWALVLVASAFNIMTSVMGMWEWTAVRVRSRPFDILGMLEINVPSSLWAFYGAALFGGAIALFAERELVRLAKRLIAQWAQWRASWT